MKTTAMRPEMPSAYDPDGPDPFPVAAAQAAAQGHFPDTDTRVTEQGPAAAGQAAGVTAGAPTIAGRLSGIEAGLRAALAQIADIRASLG